MIKEALTSIPKNAVPTVVKLIPVEKRTEDTLVQMYDERIGKVDDHIRTKLHQYFQNVQNARRGQDDWFNWCHEAIMSVATKTTVEQRTIGYLIGLFKAWLTYGFGTYFNAEFIKLLELFDEQFHVQPSRQCTDKLQKLVQDYGLTYAITSVIRTTNDDAQVDMSSLLADACVRYADTNYSKIRDKAGADK